MRKVALWGVGVVAACVVASAQISTDEAQRRLNAKLTTRPASTQPLTEVDRLRAENRRLREENLSLTTEVSQLREALATASGAAPATTAPTTAASDDPAARFVGRWEGGDLRSGNAFTLDLAADGTYRQSWLSAVHSESGHWNLRSDGILEMWTATTADAQRNHWHPTFTNNNLTLSLLPTSPDGTDLTAAKPLQLKKMR